MPEYAATDFRIRRISQIFKDIIVILIPVGGIAVCCNAILNQFFTDIQTESY